MNPLVAKGLVPLINKETSYITRNIACCSRTERGCAMATSMCTVNNGNTPPTTTAGTVVHQRTHSPASSRYICTSDQCLLVLPAGAKSVPVERVPRKKSICLEARSMAAQKTSFIYLINMPFFERVLLTSRMTLKARGNWKLAFRIKAIHYPYSFPLNSNMDLMLFIFKTYCSYLCTNVYL